MKKGLEMEVLAEFKSQGVEEKFALWKNGLVRGEVQVSVDMGWQKRSSGHKYDSASGHALMIGKHTQHVLAYVVKSKKCNTCENYDDENNLP